MWNSLRASCKLCNINEVRSFHTSVSLRATKPRWLPPAKTKIFKILPRPNYTPDEEIERRRLKNMYASQLKVTLEEFRRMYRESDTSDDVVEKQKNVVEKYWQEAMRINDEWNAQVGVEREKRDAELFELEVQKTREKMLQLDQKRSAEKTQIENLIKEQKELSKTFITEKNIDHHIEKILNSKPYTFNYAIDLRGNVYEGEDMEPNPKKKLVDMSIIEDEGTHVAESQNQATS